MQGKCVLVTGAARGIGRAVALAAGTAGADVVVNDLEAQLPAAEAVAEEIRGMGRRAVAVAGDVSQRADVEALVARARADIGPVDVLVNNAAINKVEPTVDVTPETWAAIMQTNLTATFFLTQLVAREMLQRGSGRIVNVASDAGFRGYAEHAAYGASKGALIQLTRILANEWGAQGLRVNVVAPGATWTDMTAPAMKIPEVRDSILSRGVVGRICEPDEVAAAIAYLASDESDMITGHVLSIDGGSVAR
jgi:3-oxoacyl-[acyl-carrier protein] reductase